jgi:hypothetical protein
VQRVLQNSPIPHLGIPEDILDYMKGVLSDRSAAGESTIAQQLDINANMALHAEIVLIASLRVLHLRVSLLQLILGRGRRMYDRSIDDSTTFGHGAPLRKQSSYSLHQFLLKFLRFEQVPKSSDAALIWHLIYGSLTQAKASD